MQSNRVRKTLRDGDLALGAYVGGIADVQIVEIIGQTGFDAAFIDMEHTSLAVRPCEQTPVAAEKRRQYSGEERVSQIMCLRICVTATSARITIATIASRIAATRVH